MEKNPLDIYLHELGRSKNCKKLTTGEEIELSAIIKEGKNNPAYEKAVEKLTTANLLFVVSIAKTYTCKSLSVNDLINEGNIGLIEAAKRYDHTVGVKFISYAVYWVRQAIYTAIREHSRTISLPKNIIDTYTKLNKARSRMFAERGYVDDEEITYNMCIHPEIAKDTDRSTVAGVSLDDPLGDPEEGNTRMDKYVPAQERISQDDMEEICKTVNSALKVLSVRDKNVIRDYYGIGVEYAIGREELANKYNLSQVMINKILRDSVDLMRAYLKILKERKDGRK